MRTKILTLFLTLMSVLSVKAGNSIYIDDVTAQAGDIITLSVQMTNTEADKYCGFQFDVVLPEGVSFVQNDGFYEAELSTQRTTARKTNFFDSVLQSDGSLRILCNTSASNSEVGHLYCFSGTSGEVCTIKVKVDENIKAGKQSIVLKNIALSDYSSVSHAVSDYTMELKVPSIEVTSVSLNKATLNLVEGDTENLTATVMPANATEQGVTWTSSNGNVATVDAQGKVTAVAEGTAIITATSVNGKTAQCAVVVSKKSNPVTAITLNKTTLRLTEGENEILTVTYTPENADGRSVTWTSSNGNVATVDAQGKVTAVAEGTAIITATSVNGKTAQCAVVVSKKANPVTAITLNKTTLRLTEGENEILTVTYTPEDADGRSVTWTSSNGNVATVDAQGKVTAVVEGTAIITATSVNGKTAQCAVIVSRKPNPVTSIALNKASLQITEGDSETLTVTYTPADADDRSVTWTSSNGNVATVDAQGKVTAVAEGTAIITATSVNGKTAQCAVVISKKANPVTAITLNKTTLRLTEGENEILTVTYTPENADGRSVTWTSSNGNVATVDAQGKVTAVVEGTAIITATSVNGKTAQCAVVVSRKANPVTAIALNKTTLRLTEDENETLSVTYTPEDADGRSVSWTTSDAKIATVDANGKVTAVTEGVVIVTATTTNEKIAQCVVIVENDTENISFADPNVKAVCVENWDTDGNGKLSYAEAAAVSSLSEVFRDNKDITSFEELQYFTGLTEICDNAFSECTELTSVVIPDNVTRIGEGAFWRARKLSSVNIPKNVKRIEFGAFRDCYSLNSIELPNGIESIDIWAFYGPRLNSITIPSSLVYLGNNRGYDRTFADCSCYMNSMVVEEGNPVFDSRNNCNAIIETYSNTLLFGCSNTVIPNDITSIGQYAFFDCKDMESIDLPDNLVSISGSAFSGCSGLRTVKIPDRVIAIGHEGFNNCHSLTSVTIPKGVTTIDKAFNNCENLTTVIEMREEPPVITGPDAFTNYANATLYVPYGCKAKYEVADYWKDFGMIVEMDAQPAMLGDVNGDDEVTMADANMVVNYFLATDKPENFNVEAADVNGDGDITMADANMIVNMFLNGTTTEVTNKHEAIDLGLSVKWATCNVGANSPEEFGDYFAWGETEPKETYSWENYKHCNFSYHNLTKYNSDSGYGTVDNKTVLDAEDDAATVNWGSDWRMPTEKEQEELRNNCTWTLTTLNGISGYKVTSNKEGYTNKSIFLPIPGYRENSSLNRVGADGGYWSSEVYARPDIALVIGFGNGSGSWSVYRHLGFSVRPVFSEKHEDKHEAVDLGLSVKWATCNVGAENPQDYGDYFAWGETEPKDDYDWPTYKWCNGSYNTQTKYNANSYYGTVDNRTTLEPADDAATVNWGGSWRTPTFNEQEELRDKCYWEWTTNYNGKEVSGYIVYKAKAEADKGVKKYSSKNVTTSATYSLSDNHIFLPAAGYRGNWDAYYTEQNGGYYWSNMVNPDYDAYNLFICPEDVCWRNYDRSCGQSIRPVCP